MRSAFSQGPTHFGPIFALGTRERAESVPSLGMDPRRPSSFSLSYSPQYVEGFFSEGRTEARASSTSRLCEHARLARLPRPA